MDYGKSIKSLNTQAVLSIEVISLRFLPLRKTLDLEELLRSS